MREQDPLDQEMREKEPMEITGERDITTERCPPTIASYLTVITPLVEEQAEDPPRLPGVMSTIDTKTQDKEPRAQELRLLGLTEKL